jgi:hypothetical protein
MIKSTSKSAVKSETKLCGNSTNDFDAPTTSANAMKKAKSNAIIKPMVEPNAAAEPAADAALNVTSASATAPRTTKQNQVLTLLAQTGGVTIDEVMRATGWQEHSVRGFFAGTVRKKLGFELTSEKVGDDDRRYAIKVAA